MLTWQYDNIKDINDVKNAVHRMKSLYKLLKNNAGKTYEYYMYIVGSLLLTAVKIPINHIRRYEKRFTDLFVLLHKSGYNFRDIYVSSPGHELKSMMYTPRDHNGSLIGILGSVNEPVESIRFILHTISAAINHPEFCNFSDGFVKMPALSNPVLKSECRTLFLVNNRLKAIGESYIFRDLLQIVVKELVRLNLRLSISIWTSEARYADTLMASNREKVARIAFDNRSSFSFDGNASKLRLEYVWTIWDLALGRQSETDWMADVVEYLLKRSTIKVLRIECKNRGYKTSSHKFKSSSRGTLDWLNFLISELMNDPKITFNYDLFLEVAKNLSDIHYTLQRQNAEKRDLERKLKRCKVDREGM